MYTRIILLFLLFSPFSVAAVKPPSTVIDECTTNVRTYHEPKIRINESIDKKHKKAAVLNTLGLSTPTSIYAVNAFKGQWYFEHKSEGTIFAGYKVRSHYVGVAIAYTARGTSTIIYDSANLKQSKKSIHKKASAWNETLNSKMRIEIADLSEGMSEAVRILKV